MTTALFTTTSFWKTGYDRDEVDEFFDHARAAYEGQTAQPMSATDIQHATFALVRRGYVTGEVDAALDRLEAAFVARSRSDFVKTNGQAAWMASLAERARTLYGRLSRPAEQKFSPAPGRQIGYAKADVDALCDRLVAFFDRQEPITSGEVRSAVFSTARGAEAYAEAPVDAFLARATEVLLGVE